jgi:hypothetical protein
VGVDCGGGECSPGIGGWSLDVGTVLACVQSPSVGGGGGNRKSPVSLASLRPSIAAPGMCWFVFMLTCIHRRCTQILE